VLMRVMPEAKAAIARIAEFMQDTLTGAGAALESQKAIALIAV
jgi:hypothetical protein